MACGQCDGELLTWPEPRCRNICPFGIPCPRSKHRRSLRVRYQGLVAYCRKKTRYGRYQTSDRTRFQVSHRALSRNVASRMLTRSLLGSSSEPRPDRFDWEQPTEQAQGRRIHWSCQIRLPFSESKACEYRWLEVEVERRTRKLRRSWSTWRGRLVVSSFRQR
jgi:hypothetical protein